MALQYTYDENGEIVGVEDDGVPVDLTGYGEVSDAFGGLSDAEVNAYLDSFQTEWGDNPYTEGPDADPEDTQEFKDWVGAVRSDPFSELKNVLTGSYTGKTGVSTSVLDTLKRTTGLSGAEMGLGGVGLLSALAALTSKPSTNTAESKQTGTTNQTTNMGQSQTSETTLPQWYLDLVKGQATKATELAPMTAFNKNLPDMPMDSYMNMYTEQALNPILRRMGEDQALERQKFGAERVSRGSFGTPRADLLSNQMLERQAQTRADTTAGAYNQAYTQAQGQATGDLNRQFQEWQLMQKDPSSLATTQAGILSTLKPGQITTSTGSTTGTTAGTTGQTTNQKIVGTDPNKMGQLAGMAGTLWGMSNPNGLKA